MFVHSVLTCVAFIVYDLVVTDCSFSEYITFSGPSGTGKSASARSLIDACPGIELARGYTTRIPRDQDLKRPFRHREYNYISDEKFNDLESRGMFEWSISLSSGRYATPKALFGKCDGKTFLFLVTPDTVSRIRSLAFGRVTSFYFFPPRQEEIMRRMRNRGDSDEEIAKRIVDSRDPSWIHPLKDGAIHWIPVITENREVDQTVEYIRSHLGI